MRQLHVPRVNDGPDDFDTLFTLHEIVRTASEPILLSFEGCDFLRQNAVAFLGGLLATARFAGRTVLLDEASMTDGVRRNLVKNRFLAEEGRSDQWYSDNVVPYRQDLLVDWLRRTKLLMQHLSTHLFSKNWILMSRRVEGAVAGAIAELYLNAFEHSRSEIGVFTCGQYYPTIGQAGLAIIDFGVGIPSTVREYHARRESKTPTTLSSVEALRWALASGTSTKDDGLPRGNGLDFVTEFMRANQGQLDIYTHDAAVRVDRNGLDYRRSTTSFPGVAINLLLQCDGSKYFQFRDEQ
ncbi:MAG: hypothetical protein ABFC89_08730 [Methanospirillum sp.]